MFSLLAKLFKALNSEDSPWQIAFGFCFGMISGLTPLMGFHDALIILLVLCFRINITAYLLASATFALVALPMDPIFNSVGATILTTESLQSLFTTLYLSDVWILSRFNNTLVMGSLAISVAAFIPMLFVFKWLIAQYRGKFMKWVEKFWLTRMIKASKFYQYYADYRG